MQALAFRCRRSLWALLGANTRGATIVVGALNLNNSIEPIPKTLHKLAAGVRFR